MKSKKHILAPDFELGTDVPSYSLELGIRLEAAASKLGQDISVQMTEKSWKQLNRYFKGAEPPLGVVSNLANASHTSLAYLIDGIIQVSEDAELERIKIDKSLKETRNMMAATADLKKMDALKKHESFLLERSQFFLKIVATLLSKRKYPSSYEEYLDESLIKPRNEIDPRIIEELQQSLGIFTQTTGVVSVTDRTSEVVSAAPLDQELLEMVIEEIEIFIAERSLSWSPEKKSRVIIAAYDMLSDEEAPEDASRAAANLGYLLKAAV